MWWHNRTDYRIGQAALTVLIIENWRQSNRGIYSSTLTTLALIGIWGPRLNAIRNTGIGWGLRATIFSSYGLAVGIPVAIGAGVSYAIDPDEGLGNYTGFISDGTAGNDPNYWDTDQNDSGYFNVNQNFINIISAKRRAKAAKESKEAEDKYIRQYEERKEMARQAAAAESYSMLLASYHSLSESEKQTYLRMYQERLRV